MEFIKQNWFKLLLGIGIVMIGAAFLYYFVVGVPRQGQLESQQKIQLSEVENVSRCADAAAKVFKQNGYDSRSSKEVDFYTNHWNRVLGKCFVFITSTGAISSGQMTTAKYLADAFENKIYGEFFMIGSSGTTPRISPQCSMYENGDRSKKQNCSSEAEFDDLVKPFMNN